MPPNPPRKHHYIPCFYTQQWVDPVDGKLCVFSKNDYKGIVHRRSAPAGTGWKLDLYSQEHALPEIAQKFEQEIFHPIDTQASEALDAFLRGDDVTALSDSQREAWGRFINSLLMRCPEDLDFIRGNYRTYVADISRELEEEYARTRADGDARTLAELVANATPEYIEQGLFEGLGLILDGERMIKRMRAVHWQVFDTSRSRFSLLTSDRPISRLAFFREAGIKMGLPISPTHYFVLLQNPSPKTLLSTKNADSLVTNSNRAVVEAATKYVYGFDATQKPFISKHFGKRPQVRLIQQVLLRGMAPQANINAEISGDLLGS